MKGVEEKGKQHKHTIFHFFLLVFRGTMQWLLNVPVSRDVTAQTIWQQHFDWKHKIMRNVERVETKSKKLINSPLSVCSI